MDLENKKLIADLAVDTYRDKINWKETFGFLDCKTYRFKKQLTKKKYIEIDIYVYKNINNSYLMVYFVANEVKTHIGTVKDEPMLQNLIDVIHSKIRVGKIK